MEPKQPPSLGEAIARILADPDNRVGPSVKLPAEEPPPGLTAAHAEVFAKLVREVQFQREMIDYAQARGWRVAHFRSVRVARPDGTTYWQTPVEADGKGFLDLELLRERLVKVELKVEPNTMTAEQEAWFKGYVAAGVEVYCWYPRDWPAIREVLR